jgi:hypothetical protein
MSDFLRDAAARQRAMLEAQLSAADADLKAARANSDYDGAAAAVQQYADAVAQWNNLQNIENQYVASQQPRQPEQLSPEELAAKPAHKMTADDGLRTAVAGSRWEKSITWNDPNVVAGYRETQRRRARGE